MTRYPSEHKAQTREKLLETARRIFREQGFERSSINTLMQAAGLTRGGFYAHFASKEELVREVLRIEPGLLTGLKEAQQAAAPQEAAAERFARYLDPASRDELIYCPLVAHPMDAIRGGPDRKHLYAEQVLELVESLREILGPAEADERDAILATVLGVGAAILSSAMPDAEVADRIESVCLEEIRRILSAADRPS